MTRQPQPRNADLMNDSGYDHVRDFIARAITASGGVVEDAPAGLDVLLSQDEARALGVREDLRVVLGATAAPASDLGPQVLPADGYVDGRLGSVLLERMIAARLERPVVTAVEYPPGLSVALPDRYPALLNAVRGGAPDRRRAWMTSPTCRQVRPPSNE
jgi:hypothetical protein